MPAYSTESRFYFFIDWKPLPEAGTEAGVWFAVELLPFAKLAVDVVLVVEAEDWGSKDNTRAVGSVEF